MIDVFVVTVFTPKCRAMLLLIGVVLTSPLEWDRFGADMPQHG